ncbi:hypothetical protein BCR33DRAFT_766307 [Rhizoclosmatium globosum]|uniref:G-protein coupled receptors family 3 profile domain-containing protein n=1 Tax=Rhizoclosmatium globosum TaxID=329046 RepID=A0A1Y2CBC7_9FUNG|nr:hypothetical protein BCR33DRAFT_766307 [Rhizoclosmatium globosum]|eukprot:ORY44197.1 hypothetical protein BCR33DRAFT_766307 [Rhizoclosmatium globosum]
MDSSTISYISFALMISTFCGTIWFIVISILHSQQAKKQQTFKSIATSYNLQLLLIGISTTGMYLVNVCCTCVPENPWIIQILEDMFVAIFESCYLMLSWGRGSSVIKFKSPKIAFVIEQAMQVFPFLCFLPVIASILGLVARLHFEEIEGSFITVEIIFSIIAGTIAVLMDAVYLIFFILFLQSLRFDSHRNHIDIDFVTITRYGICVHIAILLAFLFMALIYANPNSNVELLKLFRQTFASLVFFILFALKIALRNNAIAKEKEAELQMNEAKEALRTQNESKVVNVETAPSAKTTFTLTTKSKSPSAASIPNCKRWRSSNIDIFSDDLDQMRSNL